jgi:hypothetical protein
MAHRLLLLNQGEQPQAAMQETRLSQDNKNNKSLIEAMAKAVAFFIADKEK